MPDRPVIDPAVLAKIASLLCTTPDPAVVRAACTAKLGLAEADVDPAIEAAYERIRQAAHIHRDRELGAAVTRLDTLYARSLAIQDTKTALAAQREKNHLLNLSPSDAIEPDADPADPTAPDPETRRQIESQHLADLVAAVDAYLEPLGLTGCVHDTDPDLVRLAGEEITALRSQISNLKSRRKGRRKATKKSKKKDEK